MSKIVSRLEKENATLRAALMPFAKEADEWWDRIDGRYRPGMTEPRQKQAFSKASFSLGDLRRARRLVGRQA